MLSCQHDDEQYVKYITLILQFLFNQTRIDINKLLKGFLTYHEVRLNFTMFYSGITSTLFSDTMLNKNINNAHTYKKVFYSIQHLLQQLLRYAIANTFKQSVYALTQLQSYIDYQTKYFLDYIFHLPPNIRLYPFFNFLFKYSFTKWMDLSTDEQFLLHVRRHRFKKYKVNPSYTLSDDPVERQNHFLKGIVDALTGRASSKSGITIRGPALEKGRDLLNKLHQRGWKLTKLWSGPNWKGIIKPPCFKHHTGLECSRCNYTHICVCGKWHSFSTCTQSPSSNQQQNQPPPNQPSTNNQQSSSTTSSSNNRRSTS